MYMGVVGQRERCGWLLDSPLFVSAFFSFSLVMGDILQFDPFVSRIDAGFWHELAQRKLEKYKLSEEKQEIQGCYGNGR